MDNYYIYFHKNPKTLEIFYVGLGSHVLYQKYKRAEDLKKREKELAASKDQIHSFNDVVQKITDDFVKKIDEVIVVKEKELMKV